MCFLFSPKFEDLCVNFNFSRIFNIYGDSYDRVSSHDLQDLREYLMIKLENELIFHDKTTSNRNYWLSTCSEFFTRISGKGVISLLRIEHILTGFEGL